jgi:hypothetical protein
VCLVTLRHTQVLMSRNYDKAVRLKLIFLFFFLSLVLVATISFILPLQLIDYLGDSALSYRVDYVTRNTRPA